MMYNNEIDVLVLITDRKLDKSVDSAHAEE